MMLQSLHDLYGGFGVALEWHNLLWCFVGVVIGNLIGVLPGMGALSAISMLLPLTYAMHPIPAILMLAGIFYGSQYGGAIGAILLNLPTHPPHAVTCLDGYPMTKAGRGGAALGVTMIASFFAASVGIVVMVFAAPLLVGAALEFGPTELFSVMLLGLVAGATMSRGSPVKGIAMTLVGLLIGVVGTDVNSGIARFTFGFSHLSDKVELVALALGIFGVSDFLLNVNRLAVSGKSQAIGWRDMRPSRGELRASFFPMLRGTFVGVLFGAMPGTGPTVTTFIAYALEQKLGRRKGRVRLGNGAIQGVASPEAASHSKTQVDFIPTMSLGIPGDATMALILGALLVQGIQPGPQLISTHPDLFWGLIASFWIGNVLLVVLNVPLIGLWMKLLMVPYRFLFPSALLFIALGVYSTNNSLFEVGEVLVFGVAGGVLSYLKLPMAPILLGYVLGPMVEQNFRRALMLSSGDLTVFVQTPFSAVFVTMTAAIVAIQFGFWIKRMLQSRRTGMVAPVQD